MAYPLLGPFYYFWLYIKHQPTLNKYFFISTEHFENQIGVIEAVTRIVLLIFFDVFFSDILPKTLFGTKDLEVFPDLILRKSTICLGISLVSIGPLNPLLQYMFRQRKQTSKKEWNPLIAQKTTCT